MTEKVLLILSLGRNDFYITEKPGVWGRDDSTKYRWLQLEYFIVGVLNHSPYLDPDIRVPLAAPNVENATQTVIATAAAEYGITIFAQSCHIEHKIQ